MTPYFQDDLSAAEVDELRRYHDNPFDFTAVESGLRLPLEDEPFVATWERWLRGVAPGQAYATLATHLPQLAFPVAEGMSDTEDYQAATRRGASPARLPGATGLAPPRPETVEVVLHQSPAGRVPLIISRHRETFVLLVQALARRNEPRPVPPSMGALMVAGFNNWQRIHEHRQTWESTPEERRPDAWGATWEEEFARLRPQKELYQDRFILLSDGSYSGVAAAELGLEEDAWRRASLAIRRDHECAHYLTRRLLGSMRNNVLDELLADYAGMQAVPDDAGGPGFRAAWFLRFLGLESYPDYRPGARLDIYRGEPPLSDAAFRALFRQIHAAAHGVERFDRERTDGPPGRQRTALTVLALACLRFDELATADGPERLGKAVEWVRGRLS